MTDRNPKTADVSNGGRSDKEFRAQMAELDHKFPRKDHLAELIEMFGNAGDATALIENPTVARDVVMAYARVMADRLAVGPWDEPVPLVSNRDLPTFPTGALPPTLGGMVQAVAANTQTPVDLPAVIGLAALAASLVGRVEFEIRDGWCEPVTVYALGLIGSGNRKSSLVRPLTQPLWDAQADLQRDTYTVRDRTRQEKEMVKAQLDGAKSRLKKQGQGDDAEREFMELQVAFDALAEPNVPVLIVNDATPEALAKTMCEQGERLAMFDAEGGGLTTMVGGRYTTAPNLDLMLKAHAGDSVSQVRVGRDSVSMQRPVFVMGVLSQPETLRELRGVEGARERGLFARLLVAAPPDMLGQRAAEVAPIGLSVIAQYRALLMNFVTTLWVEPQPRLLRPDREAYQALMSYHDHVESRLGPEGDLRPLEGYAGKLVGAAARYAALHHLAWYGVAGLNYPVTAASVSWGIEIATWATEHHRFAVAELGLTGNALDGQRVLTWLTRLATSEVTTRQVQRETNLPTVDQTVAALELLEERGWVRREASVAKSGPGRKSSPRWAVHPKVANQ